MLPQTQSYMIFLIKKCFYTTHQVYDYENVINQILLKGLNILSKIVTNANLKDRIARIKLDFPEIKEIQITKDHFDQLKESRKTVAYNEAIKEKYRFYSYGDAMMII